MTDWRLEVDLGQLMTDGDLPWIWLAAATLHQLCCLLLCLLCSARHRQWSYISYYM